MMREKERTISSGVCPQCQNYRTLEKSDWGNMCADCKKKVKALANQKSYRGAGIG